MARTMRPRGTETPSARDYTDCRTYSHAWSQFYPTDWEAPLSGWRLSLRCTRCDTQRHDLISASSGGLLGRRYEWPEDYRIAGEAPSRDELRAQMFTRLKAQLAEHNAVGNITPIRKRRAS
jgi:hypothetical protein